MNQMSEERVDDALSDPALIEQLRSEVTLVHKELSRVRNEAELQLRIASQVHRSLLPSPIRTSRVDVDVRYLPIETVGGDYCQVRFPDPSSCYITMCDVAGHGVGRSRAGSGDPRTAPGRWRPRSCLSRPPMADLTRWSA